MNLAKSAIGSKKDFCHICKPISAVLKTFRNLNNYTEKKPLALSIGMFDGVHQGHQSIISQLKKVSAEKKIESGILTFWPHPRLIFNPQANLRLLNTLEEKIQLLEKFGLENLFLQDFDKQFRNLSGEEFIREILVKKLNVKHLIVGYDHSFGKNKSGNFELLKKLAPELGLEVEKTAAVSIDEENISSTKIRNLLAEGEISEANKMLGYNYSLCGTVVHGKMIGRTIGYPTANLETEPHKLLPKKGAYITSAILEGKFYKSMTSIGTNPTVNGEKLTVETYILNFSGDIYGKKLTLNFHEFLHNEIKFDGIENLVKKLDEDKFLTENFNY